VASALLTPSAPEVVTADAHRAVASEVDFLQTARSTWVSLMYLAAGRTV